MPDLSNEKIWNDECGVFGIFGHDEASTLTYLGLYALQHRGQESAGIVSDNNGEFMSYRQMGLVNDIFKKKHLEQLAGRNAIGHVRYSTAGQSVLKNAQPFVVETSAGPLAVAHNGNLTNALTLRKELEENGSIFQSSMDTEVIVHLIARSKATTIEEKVAEALGRLEGAFSLVIMSNTAVFAARDPYGFRPLVLGEVKGAKVIASETCALDLIGATYMREVAPGEMVVISADSMRSVQPFAGSYPVRNCVFEQIYFARPDSHVFGQDVYELRKEFGRQLAREAPIDADVVIPVPDSGVPAAMGFAEQSNLPYELGLVRNHYVGRTFIEPEQSIRNFGVRLKLNPIRSLLVGKRVVVIDDSIVRGTTSRKILQTIRDAGAKEIHVRISSPPITDPCYYGIDTPRKSELIGSNYEVEEIAKYIGADSLAYLTEEGLRTAAGANFCFACFNGQYPLEIADEAHTRQMKLFEL